MLATDLSSITLGGKPDLIGIDRYPVDPRIAVGPRLDHLMGSKKNSRDSDLAMSWLAQQAADGHAGKRFGREIGWL